MDRHHYPHPQPYPEWHFAAEAGSRDVSPDFSALCDCVPLQVTKIPRYVKITRWIEQEERQCEQSSFQAVETGSLDGSNGREILILYRGDRLVD